VDFDLSVASQNRWREVDAGHASRSSGLLRVEAILTRVSRVMMTGGARDTIAEVASEAS
jgi:hypothetical protein